MSQVLFLGLSGGRYRVHKGHRANCDVRGEEAVDLISRNKPLALGVVPGAEEEEGAGRGGLEGQGVGPCPPTALTRGPVMSHRLNVCNQTFWFQYHTWKGPGERKGRSALERARAALSMAPAAG